MKKLLLTALAVVILAGSVSAAPTLQVYIPSATYINETWVTHESSFEIWVVADLYDGIIEPAHRQDLYGIQLIASLGKEGSLGAPGDLKIFAEDKTTLLTTTPWINGIPPAALSDWNVPPHGIYPSWFTELAVESSTFDKAATDEIRNYQDPISGVESMGIIYRYWVETEYDYVHFDAYCYTSPQMDQTTKYVAPFSHDAEYVVPEPTTMLLFGFGLAGAGVVRRFRSKK
ncbi:MAG: choice-of-anchor N protein [candidate division Zixibacteria bacterium]|nr:choice-of-anchor N protein [candidate division Zixibacteria bacterium]